MDPEEEGAGAAAQFEGVDLGKRMGKQLEALIIDWGEQLQTAIAAYPTADYAVVLKAMARLMRDAADAFDPPGN